MTDPYEVANKAATEFPPTLPQKELEGKTFLIKDIRHVTTQFGERNVAVIQFHGTDEDIETWLNGVRVKRQLAALQEAGAFPAWFKLGRDTSIEGEPYVLLKPDSAPPNPNHDTWEKRLADLGKEYVLKTERVLELLEAKAKEGESPAGTYKRVRDELITATGDREEAHHLIYEKLYAKIVPPPDDLPFE